MSLKKNHIDWLLRLPIIGTFIYHGFPKLGESVANLGYIGYLVGPFEFIGALFLLIGPFINNNISKLGLMMLTIILLGIIYMHLFTWNHPVTEIEWQILLLAVSLYLLIKDYSSCMTNNEIH